MEKERAERGDVSDAVTMNRRWLAAGNAARQLPSMLIPESAWFAMMVTSLAGCIAWYRRAPSRHLLMAAGALGWMTLVSLPGLYAELFGHKELARIADPLFEKLGSKLIDWNGSAEWLLYWCGQVAWPGMAFLALGLWRVGNSLTPDLQKP